MKPVYKPSQVPHMTRSGKMPQRIDGGRITCQAAGHRVPGTTESPTFWESGCYVACLQCGPGLHLARPIFPDFEIDLRGERKAYPLEIA